MQQFQLQNQAKLFLNKSQFSIEFLISITIFAIAFISLVSLVNNYVNALKLSKERMIANFLAQEGLELIIAYRNIKGINDLVSFDNIFPATSTYCIDYTLNLQNTSSPCPLYINQNGFYTHNSINASSTIFSRLIHIDKRNNYVIVESKVSFGNQEVKLNTILTSWLTP